MYMCREVLVEMAIPGRRHKKPVTLVARVVGSFCHIPFDTYLIFFVCVNVLHLKYKN